MAGLSFLGTFARLRENLRPAGSELAAAAVRH